MIEHWFNLSTFFLVWKLSYPSKVTLFVRQMVSISICLKRGREQGCPKVLAILWTWMWGESGLNFLFKLVVNIWIIFFYRVNRAKTKTEQFLQIWLFPIFLQLPPKLQNKMILQCPPLLSCCCCGWIYAFGSNMIISAIRMFKALTLKAFGIDADWQLELWFFSDEKLLFATLWAEIEFISWAEMDSKQGRNNVHFTLNYNQSRRCHLDFLSSE